MTAIKKYGLLAVGIVFLAAALFVGAAALPAVARGNQGNIGNVNANSNSNSNSNSNMMGNGMMNNGLGSMMGGRSGNSAGGMMGDVDRHFIEQMIPHHQAAIEMADLALKKAQRPEIRTLAASIKQTQSAEIVQMRTWYRQWYGTDVSTNGAGVTGSGMMGGSTTGGMMGSGRGGMMGGCEGMGGDASDLANAPDFDKAFIEAMIPHHEMALMMTSMEQTLGQKSELRTLAQRMYTAQSAEIVQMRAWYRQWYGSVTPTN